MVCLQQRAHRLLLSIVTKGLAAAPSTLRFPQLPQKNMTLITKALSKKIPALYAQDGQGKEAIAFVKLFTPWSDWTWYITEMDPATGECFGLVKGLDDELGYFNLRELETLRGPAGLKVERDRFFDPRPLSAL